MAAAQGPIASFGFNNPTAPYQDDSGHGQNGSCATCPSYLATGGKYGDGALNFSGSGNWVELPTESAFDFTTQLTASVWIKVSGFNTAWETFLAKGDSSWSVGRYDATRNATGPFYRGGLCQKSSNEEALG